MKKHFLLCALLALPLSMLADAKTVPYTSPIYQDAEWTIVDNNGDSKTWADYSSNESLRYYYTANAADDWAISPAITLEAGTEYKLSLMMKTSSFAESFKTVLGTAPDVASLNASQVLEENAAYKNSSWTKHAYVVTPETTGEYYFAIQVTSKDQYTLEIKDFACQFNVLIPGDVTGLTATVGENEAVEVTLAWTLPVKDEDGNDMSAAVDGIEICRDGEPVATLGAVTSWTDTEELGLTPGFHEYKVIAKVGNAASKGATVKTAFVGPTTTPWELPFYCRFSDVEEIIYQTFWTTIDANADGKCWTRYAAWNSTYIQYYQTEQSDDYLVTPALAFDAPGVYKLTWTGWQNSAVTSTLDVVLGTDKTVEALTQPVATFSMEEHYNDQTYVAYFEVAEAGTHYLAFHTNTANETTFKITSVKVEQGAVLPTQATDLTVKPAADFSLMAEISWTNAKLSNLGTPLTSLSKVELYRDGDLVKTYTMVEPGENMTCLNTVPEAGVYQYSVRTYNENGEAEGEAPKLTSKWIGDPTQTIPYVCNFLTDSQWGLWTVVNANADDLEWVRSSAGSSKFALLAAGEHNDYLIAPPVMLEADQYYNVKFEATPDPVNMTYTFGYVTDLADAAGTFHAIQELHNLRNYLYYEPTDHFFHNEEAQKVYFAWWVNGNSGTYDCKLSAVSVEVLPVVPALATDLAAVAAADKVLQVAFSWTNPAETNVEGVACDVITKAEVYRDGELIAELTEGLVPGEQTTYVDETVTAGVHTYGVLIYNANGKNTAAMPTVASDWVGGGYALPYSYHFGRNVFTTDGWTNIDANDDTSSRWYPEATDLTIYSASYENDEWAISPKLELASSGEGSLYRVTVPAYVYLYDSGHPTVDFQLAYGASLDPAEMNVIADLTITARGTTDDDAEPLEATFSLPQGAEGTYYVAIHANHPGLQTFVSIEVVDESTPTGISSVELHSTHAAYNLQGQRVKGSEKGILLIQDGQKILVK